VSKPLYRIGTLAKLTGLSTHAIRVWERRYQATSPDRSPGGARLYTDDDVRRFRLIQQLLKRGYATRAIANLDFDELSALAEPAPTPSTPVGTIVDEQAASTVTALLGSLSQMNVEAAERILLRAGNEFSPRELVTRVLAPALVEIGARWQEGSLCTASEHAASAMLRTRLGALLSAQQVSDAPPIICTTPAGERHELGALLAAVLVAMRGRRAVYLGADLPADQIAEAARLADAPGIVLSIVALAPKEASRELGRIAEALPARVEIVVGGRGVIALRRVPARMRVLGSLAELEHWVDRL
jgi:DNA-binding transcriptional MerR regulator/methylmalonyl-CoA mutase cobalamin-binding subunit